MKKLLLTTAIALAMGGTAVLAHHPAADIVDPEIYDMIEENISINHLEMDFEDMDNMATNDNPGQEISTSAGSGRSDAMGGDTSDVGAATEATDGVRNSGELFDGGDSTDVGSSFDTGASISGDEAEEVGEANNQLNVDNAEAELSSPGPGSASDSGSGSDSSPGSRSGRER